MHFPKFNPIIDLRKRCKTAVEPPLKHDCASLSLIQHSADNPLRKQQRPFDQPILAWIHRKLGVSAKYTIRPSNDEIPSEVLQEADPSANPRQVTLLLHIVTLQPPIDDTPDDSHKMNDQQWCQDVLQCRIPDRRYGAPCRMTFFLLFSSFVVCVIIVFSFAFKITAFTLSTTALSSADLHGFKT